MLLNVLLLMVAYYILKTLREPLILLGGGADVKTYAAAGQAVLLMGFVPAYAWVSSKVPRLWLITGVTVFFAVNLELFFLGALAEVSYLGVIFYIWLGVFVLAMLSQFWAYANDTYTEEEGNRLFPVIAIGATAGSPLGSKLAGSLFERGVSIPVMIQLAVLLLLCHAALAYVINRRQRQRELARQEDVDGVPLQRGNGFERVFRSRYILYIAGILVLLNLVNTTGEYILSRAVLDRAADVTAADGGLSKQEFIGSFYGDFYFWVNIVGVTLQAFLVSRLTRYLGLAGVLFLLPVVSLGVYGAVATGVGFVALRWLKTAENATDYSVMNTAKAMVWLPTTREQQYQAKQAVDTFFVRAGDVVAAGVVFLGTAVLTFSIRSFALINLVFIACWSLLSVLVYRRYRKMVPPEVDGPDGEHARHLRQEGRKTARETARETAHRPRGDEQDPAVRSRSTPGPGGHK